MEWCIYLVIEIIPNHKLKGDVRLNVACFKDMSPWLPTQRDHTQHLFEAVVIVQAKGKGQHKHLYQQVI